MPRSAPPRHPPRHPAARLGHAGASAQTGPRHRRALHAVCTRPRAGEWSWSNRAGSAGAGCLLSICACVLRLLPHILCQPPVPFAAHLLHPSPTLLSYVQKQRQGTGGSDGSYDLLSYVEFTNSYRAVVESHTGALKAIRNFWRQASRLGCDMRQPSWSGWRDSCICPA